jgi:hypothetical protein
MSTVHVHIERPTPRARYAVTQVLERMLGWTIAWTDAEAFHAVQGPKLVYGRAEVPGAWRIAPAGLLEEEGVRSLDPEMVLHEGVPVLFSVKEAALPYDPFAAAFFLLTRYEEVAGLSQDVHGRPLTPELHAARHGYLARPVVDEWALQLAAAWKKTDPQVPDPIRRYRHVITVDLDNGFMYRGRETWRTLGSAVRDLLRGDTDLVRERRRVLRGDEPDPYDIYERLQADFTPHADRTIFFVLTAPRSAFDHAVPVDFPPYRERLKGLSAWAGIGLHPSYDTSWEPPLFQHQRDVLAHAVGVPIQSSRQHFLRMRVPETYRHLVAVGIHEDHTMGLHDRGGFRAGTCTPYQWYDLKREAAMDLVVHPFAIMDNTLREKLKLGPGEAVAHVLPLIEAVRNVNGTFTGLWHESFLSDHGASKGWRDAILRIIQAARP